MRNFLNLTHLVGSIALGVIYCLAFSPFEWWPVGLLAMCGFFYLLLVSPRPLLLAWCFGLGKYGLGASWVYVSINVYGQAPPLLALFLVSIFVSGMALFCIPIGWVAGHTRRRGLSPGWVLFSAAMGWVLMDWLLTWFLTGFPWLFIGYAMVGTLIGEFAGLIGVLGINALVAIMCAALVWQLQRRQFHPVASGLIVLPWLLGLMLVPLSWTDAEASRKVTLVQGNLDQAVKWNADQRLPNWDKHAALTEPHWDSDLIVWPEAAVTMFP